MTDLAGGLTGMLFDNVGAGVTTQLTGNIVDLLVNDPSTHRGIIFSQVNPGFTLLTPGASTTNTIFNAASPQAAFSIPAGSGAVGGILINSAFFQAPNF